MKMKSKYSSIVLFFIIITVVLFVSDLYESVCISKKVLLNSEIVIPNSTLKDEYRLFKELMKNETKIVQRNLFDLQHPENCRNVKYVWGASWERWPKCGGFASRFLFYRGCLSQAYMTNAVYIQERCHSWDCIHFKNWTSCTWDDFEYVKQKNPGDISECLWRMPIVNKNTYGFRIPEEYDKKPFGLLFWHSQLTEYLFLLRPETQREVDAYVRKIGWKYGIPKAGIHMRSTDKIEARLHPLSRYVSGIQEMFPIPCIKEYFLATDSISSRDQRLSFPNVTWLDNPSGDGYKQRPGTFNQTDVLKNIIDIILLSQSDVISFTYSSNFGAVAFYLHLIRNQFVSNIYAVDATFFIQGPEVYTHIVAKKWGSVVYFDIKYDEQQNGVPNQPGCQQHDENEKYKITSEKCIYSRFKKPIQHMDPFQKICSVNKERNHDQEDVYFNPSLSWFIDFPSSY